MLLYDAKRAFLVKWLWISMASTVVLVLFTRMDEITNVFRDSLPLAAGWTGSFLLESLVHKNMIFLLPVLCALPFSSAYIDEYKSGMMKFALLRVERKSYLLSKVITAAAAGGTILVAGAAAVMVVSAVIFRPIENWENVDEMLENPLFPLFVLTVRYFCFGALGAVIGLCASTITNNRYMAWMGPFMMEYLLIIFCERYFEEWIIFSPAEWLNPEKSWPLDEWGVCIWMLLLTAFAAWVFVRAAERRMSDG